MLRRWHENQLPAEQIQPAVTAAAILAKDALPTLSQVAGDGSQVEARQADAELAKVEKLLASLLQEGDLTRHLTDLITKQEHLTEESRNFVLAHLTQELDDAARAQQSSIAGRQSDVAQEMKELERQILANTAAQLEGARGLVHDHPIGPRLAEASEMVGSPDHRPEAVKTQSDALADMRKLLDALRGGDAAGDLADRIGELAARQESLVKQLDAGKNPADLAQQQKELTDAIERMQAEAQSHDAQAGKAMAAAGVSAGQSAKGMQQGDRPGATRDAATAAALLRAAQERLSPESPDGEKKKPDDKRPPDIMQLLKELLALESQLVADATLSNQVLLEKPLDFAASRTVAGYAQRQSDILLRLREEGIKALADKPIATLGLNRVAAAMQKTQDHLQTPALGATGMRLLKISLAELSRLIDICDADVPHNGDQRSSGGGGAANAQFPPLAELSLLAAMQQEIAHMTDAARPIDLAKSQGDLRDLVEGLEQRLRPGSRASLLMGRSRRAMASAAADLGANDRGLLTRDEQMDAEAEIRRMMAESGEGGGKGSSPRTRVARTRRTRGRARPASPPPAPRPAAPARAPATRPAPRRPAPPAARFPTRNMSTACAWTCRRRRASGSNRRASRTCRCLPSSCMNATWSCSMPSRSERRLTRSYAIPEQVLTRAARLLAGLPLLLLLLLLMARSVPASEVISSSVQTPDQVVDRGLAALAHLQQPDGSYQEGTASTALAGMAFLAGGSTALRGPYREASARCLQSIIRGQDKVSGYLAASSPSMYSHGFATLYLAEHYGMAPDQQVRRALEAALELIYYAQNSEGGWRYNPVPDDADLSVTICQVMALRAAYNAGVGGDQTQESMNRALAYVRRCANPSGSFNYQAGNGAVYANMGPEGCRAPQPAACA